MGKLFLDWLSLDRGATMRSASAERPIGTKKKPKKKVASHVDLGKVSCKTTWKVSFDLLLCEANN